MAAKTKSIRQKQLIPALPEAVYDCFVNARKHTAFTGSKATGLGRAGCKFTAWDGYIAGKHLELDRPNRIVQEWTTSGWPEGAPPSRLEFTFKAKKDGTEVTMVQSNIPAEQAASYDKGWVDYYWTPLKAYFSK